MFKISKISYDPLIAKTLIANLIRWSSGGPLQILLQKYESQEFLRDEGQITVMKHFENLRDNLSSNSSPQGVYVHGTVGGGKTTLMDIFYHTCTQVTYKARLHFNAFMTDVHSQIHEAKQNIPRQSVTEFQTSTGSFDPTKPVAANIYRNSKLLCLDEFQVTDIADAMILRQLFTHLFQLGLVIVATSNRAPDDLYKGGLQRSNFLPFIDLLKQHTISLTLDSGIDYRQVARKGSSGGYYFVISKGRADEQAEEIFKILCAQENDSIRPKTITHMGRDLNFQRTCGRVVDTTFSEICEANLAASDYLRAAHLFHTFIIRNVPKLNLKQRNAARRFIILIDTLYDNRNRVVITAEASINSLFSKEMVGMDDGSKEMMDSLGVDKSSANVFSGGDEIFSYDRTMSRLSEMQTQKYWQSWEKH